MQSLTKAELISRTLSSVGRFKLMSGWGAIYPCH